MKKFIESHRPFVACFLLAFATLAVYGQTVRFDFTNYDDPFLIITNSFVRGGLTLEGFFWSLTTCYYEYWHPVTWWSHMLDCQMFGLRPGWHHLMSVGFHVANSLLVFTVFHHMTGKLIRSGIVAAFFSLHPLHVESVAWLSERKDVLSAFFLLLSIWSYVRFVAESKAKTSKAEFFYTLTFLLYALGLMSKPMVVTLPFVLLLLDYWPLSRFQATETSNGGNASQLKTFGHLVREKLPLFALSFVSCAISYFGVKTANNILSTEKIPWSMRWANVPVSYARYLGKMIWPSDLAVLYPIQSHRDFWHVGGAVLLLLVISLAVLILMRPAPYLVFGWFMFLGMLVPTIGLVPVSVQSIADRYTYIPSIGLFAATVWGIADISVRWKYRTIFIAGGTALVVLACATLSWVQIGYWRNSVTLWTHCLTVAPDNVMAHYNLGHVLQHSGQTSESMEQYRAVLRIQPDHLDANLNLGIAYATAGEMREATNYLAKALLLKPDYEKAHLSMGHALIELGDFEGAAAHCAEAAQLDPNDSAAFTFLGRALSSQGKSDEALRCYSEALRLDPLNSKARDYLGLEWLERRQFDEAVASLREAVRLDPISADKRLHLAAAFAAQHATGEAISQYRESLRLDPNSPEALNNLAWLLATCPNAEFRNGTEAVRLASKACERTSNQKTIFIGTLAAAYAEAGQFEKAVETAQRACALAKSLGQTNLLERNEQLRRQFEERKAYRELN